MRKLFRNTLIVASTTLSSLPLLFFFLPSQPAQAAKWCWCTDYVANKFGLTRNYPDAANWNDGYLQQNGLTPVKAQAGAIVVMERTFPGADTGAGHVGIVEQVLSDGRLVVRGANQGSPTFMESDCTNVRLTTFARSINGRTDISFWQRGSSNTSSIRSVSFSATAAPAGVNVRSGPSLTAAIVGRLAPNQRVSFDAWTYGSVATDIWLGTPDARWYRLTGTNNWVASAVVFGNAPGSKPMP